MHSHMTPITLNRLERVEVEGLINYQARGKSVPDEVVEHIVKKADGVPLYVEELTKTMLGSDYLQEEEDCYTLAGSLAEVSIPTTLQDSLMARLDHLPALREVAQLGSVLGREFAYDMLQSIAPHEEPTLQDGLGQLVESELLYQRGRGKRARYIFKHALIQDAAYQSLLKRTRQQYHKQVAELIENKLPDTAAVQPELLARHYSEAGEFAQAVEHWCTAGRIAAASSANTESITHFRHALDDIQKLADTPERARVELDVQKSLGPALIASMGYGAQDVQETYTRARDLCDQIGSEPADRFPVLRGLWNSYLFAAQLDEARDRGAELLQLAEEIADPALIVEACRVMGTVSFVRGDFVDARRYTERVGGLYDP
jgi:predicted ATPase